MKICDVCACAMIRQKLIGPHMTAGLPNIWADYSQGECEWCTQKAAVADRPDLDLAALELKVFGPGTWTP